MLTFIHRFSKGGFRFDLSLSTFCIYILHTYSSYVAGCTVAKLMFDLGVMSTYADFLSSTFHRQEQSAQMKKSRWDTSCGPRREDMIEDNAHPNV